MTTYLRTDLPSYGRTDIVAHRNSCAVLKIYCIDYQPKTKPEPFIRLMFHLYTTTLFFSCTMSTRSLGPFYIVNNLIYKVARRRLGKSKRKNLNLLTWTYLMVGYLVIPYLEDSSRSASQSTFKHSVLRQRWNHFSLMSISFVCRRNPSLSLEFPRNIFV